MFPTVITKSRLSDITLNKSQHKLLKSMKNENYKKLNYNNRDTKELISYGLISGKVLGIVKGAPQQSKEEFKITLLGLKWLEHKKEEKSEKRRNNFRANIAICISLLALIVAISSLALQYKEYLSNKCY